MINCLKIKENIRFWLIGIMVLILSSCGTSKSLSHKPITEGYNTELPVINKMSDTEFVSGDHFFIKNKQSLWELYVAGDPLERGLMMGALTDSLLKKQESIFFSKIEEIVPSKFKQKVLRSFLKWYNRKLYLNVPEEYKTEIYGIAEFTSNNFNYIAPRYLRSLYLHGAHDIGHALQDLALVGCSSFAAWGDKTEDGNLLIGRNFDFYAGDEFAKDKVVAFIQPDKGYPFMMVTWAGMIGVCSGMNSEGLTVTINAGKSKIPLVAKTPISILSREILQYAKNIDEAIAIAKNREVFVSESIMVGSANDNKAILIEVAPNGFGVYEVPNTTQLVCSNHFQSDSFKDDKRNKSQIINSHSKYRFERMQELIAENVKISPIVAVEILRNREGLKDKPLGYGNEKALNQLLAHHGIVFQPSEKLVWVSANPYQLGEFVCYDLKKIFSEEQKRKLSPITSLATEEKNIPQDIFIETKAYKDYEKFRIEDRKMDAFLNQKEAISASFINDYQALNPNYWVVHYKAGLYYYRQKKYEIAKKHFEEALKKEITTLPSRKEIEKYVLKINRKIQ